MGGMFSPILGAIGDTVGLTTVMFLIAGFALLAAGISAVIARLVPHARVQ
ncbi:MAG: hypothetical protein ACLSVD_07260 [Eggerthellaceae bacterium]